MLQLKQNIDVGIVKNKLIHDLIDKLNDIRNHSKTKLAKIQSTFA